MALHVSDLLRATSVLAQQPRHSGIACSASYSKGRIGIPLWHFSRSKECMLGTEKLKIAGGDRLDHQRTPVDLFLSVLAILGEPSSSAMAIIVDGGATEAKPLYSAEPKSDRSLLEIISAQFLPRQVRTLYLREEQSSASPTTETRRLGCCRCRLPPPAAFCRHLLSPSAAATARCRCLPLFAAAVLFVGLIPTIMKGDGIAAENSAMVASRRGRSGRGSIGMSQNGKGDCGKLICSHCGKEGHLQNRCYDLIGWPNKTANISSSDIPSNERTSSQFISNEEYQEFLRLKSNNHAQSSASPSVSTTCISHSMGSQGPWIIDLGASNHISGNDSMFSSISSPKFPHFISLANGSKM
ncbi:hypothetical protein CR513_47606, partial [Mucuna pruriens]